MSNSTEKFVEVSNMVETCSKKLDAATSTIAHAWEEKDAAKAAEAKKALLEVVSQLLKARDLIDQIV
jgi:exonuclease VII small subunit